MTSTPSSEPMRLLIDYLGELGPRWGLPKEPCRVHAYLYLCARPVGAKELGTALGLNRKAIDDALVWLGDYRLVEATAPATWRTDSDPWEVMLRALEERRRREAAPALEVLREAHRLAADQRERTLSVQIGKLLSLAEDIVAIDAQARRLSPRTLRQMVGIGASAARLFDRTFGKRSR